MRFPHFQQLDQMDCGAACIKIIAEYYGKPLYMETIREKGFISKQGVSFTSMYDAAESFGFRVKAVCADVKELMCEVLHPCIVHWNQNHFVVVYKIKKHLGQLYVYVSDPASTDLQVYKIEDFLLHWLYGHVRENDDVFHIKGAVLMLEPTLEFYTEDNTVTEKKMNSSLYLLSYLSPYKRYLVQLFLAMIVACTFNLLLPFITQTVVDKGILNGNLSFVQMMLIAQFVLVIGQTLNEFIRSWLSLHMTSRISISIVSDYLTRLMTLPISFFDSKKFGDIIQRIQDTERIRQFLTESLLNIVVSCVVFFIYGIIIGTYSLMVLSIFLIGTLLYAAWISCFLKVRRKLDYDRFYQAGNNQSTIVQLINGMQDIKLNNCERLMRWKWERIQVNLFKISIKVLGIQQGQTIGGIFIDQTKNILISFVAAKAVINGDITLGMMTAMQYIIGQLNGPVSQMISFVQETQDAKLSFERINEVNLIPKEDPNDGSYCGDIPLNGKIEFKNVAFQYGGNNSPYVLNDISFVIPENKVTAIVGPSGSGKTTILKLILGFYKPVKGEVLLGGKKIEQYSPVAWRKNCGTVMQNGFIFNDTIKGNISLSDDYPDMDRVRNATNIANIDEFIQSLPMGYDTKIGVEGQDLSSGQKQRILIARAVYKKTKFLLFDEATNSLDANNEKIIHERLERLFLDKTVVVVAHRLSTVKNADNIIVINDGRIVEQGKHNDLISQKGFYFELVKNQLELGL